MIGIFRLSLKSHLSSVTICIFKIQHLTLTNRCENRNAENHSYKQFILWYNGILLFSCDYLLVYLIIK